MRASIHKRLVLEERGFTLPEMLVTMTVMIVVLFALYSIFDMSLRTFSFGTDKVEAVENARLGMQKMEREIRAAYAFDKGAKNTATPDTRLFDIWDATRIRFGNDLNGNMAIECASGGPCELIAYQVYKPAGSSTYTLGRTNSYSGTLEPVIEYVDYKDSTDTGLRFRYFKHDGTTEVLPGGNEAEIAMVRIELRIRVKNQFQDGTQTLTTNVALRNRGE